MAGEWLQIDLDLPEKPEVQAIARASAKRPNLSAECPQVSAECALSATLGRLMLFWRWVERHAPTSLVRRADVHTLIALCGGDELFWQSVEAVGWVSFTEEGIVIPGWEKRFSVSAKRRAMDAKRKRQSRGSAAKRVRKMSESCPQNVRNQRTKLGPKGEESREEKNKGVNPLKPPLPPLPEILDTPEFRKAWLDWQVHRIEIKKPLKPKTVAAQIEMLASKGHDAAIAMIRHTIAMGWQGLRDPEPIRKHHGAGNERPILDANAF